VLEVFELALDESLELNSVFALEASQFLDAVLDQGLFLLEAAHVCALLSFGFAHDTSGSCVALGDESIALGQTITNMLFVELSSQLKQVIGVV
jgi:hypothetical protein